LVRPETKAEASEGAAKTESAWNTDDYLVVEPGEKIAPVYDWEEVIRANRDR